MRSACDAVREAVSAELDGEEAFLPAHLVAAHLAGCAPCREFAAATGALNRRMRVRVLEPAPDLVTGILAAHSRAAPRRTHGGRVGPVGRGEWWRAARWAAAVVPLGVALPALALGAFTHPHIVGSHPPSPCTRLVVDQSRIVARHTS